MPNRYCRCCGPSSADEPRGHDQGARRHQAGRAGRRSRRDHCRGVGRERADAGSGRRAGRGAEDRLQGRGPVCRRGDASSPRSGRWRSPRRLDKDPRFVEVVLGESKRVVRHRPGLLIVEHRLGFVMANAGIDHSNIPHRRRDRARAAVAARPGRLGARLARAPRRRIRGADRGRHQRQLWPGRGARAPSASRLAPQDCRR